MGHQTPTQQARRAASVEVARRVAAIKATWGFEEIEVRRGGGCGVVWPLPDLSHSPSLHLLDPSSLSPSIGSPHATFNNNTQKQLRVDWAAEYLLVALHRLEGALQEYYGGSAPTTRRFAGLDLVAMQAS